MSRPFQPSSGTLSAALRAVADPSDAHHLRRFFKTGPGEYGAGDVFIGVRVPAIRRLARQFADIDIGQAVALLGSGIHEERLLALLIWVRQYQQGDEATRDRVFQAYLDNRARVNNWDLVDLSAEHIVGAHLFHRPRQPLHELSVSHSLWDRRIAIVSTYHFIRRDDFAETLAIATRLIGDREDLIHKAVGWMLREVGKRNREAEETFLRRHGDTMPRTMLRYAIERFPEPLRQSYLAMGK